MPDPKFIAIKNQYINRSTIRNVELIEDIPVGTGKLKIFFITGDPISFHYPLKQDAYDAFGEIWVDLRQDS